MTGYDALEELKSYFTRGIKDAKTQYDMNFKQLEKDLDILYSLIDVIRIDSCYGYIRFRNNKRTINIENESYFNYIKRLVNENL